jgi:hypothetical protein
VFTSLLFPLTLLFLFQHHSSAEPQERRDTLKTVASDLLRRTMEWASESADISPMLDNLRRLEEDPLDVANATSAELQQIPGVSAQAAYKLVAYRKQHVIHDVVDLRNLKDVEPEIIDAIEPFIVTSGKPRAAKYHPAISLRTRVLRNTTQSASAADGQYPGSPEKLYMRLSGRFSLGGSSMGENSTASWNGPSVSVGILTSKDPGESNVADLARGQAVLHLPAIATRIVVGDFLMDGGQGLVFWRPTGFSKGGEATSAVARNGSGVWPSLSTGQALTFRGIGLNTQQSGLGLHVFGSTKRTDATADSAGVITHIGSDDLHRTDAELGRRNALTESVVGGRLTYELGHRVRLGVSGFRSTFDRWVRLSGPFGFSGSRQSAYGLDCMVLDENVCAFAEVARDQSNAAAGVAGFSAAVRGDLTIAFLARSYSRGYNNFHSSGFSESGDGCKNESGFYAGLTFRPFSWLRVSAFVDQFTFPWRTYGSMMASEGHEYFAGADVKIRENVILELQARQKTKTEANALDGESGADPTSTNGKGRNTYKGTVRFEPSTSLRWQSCVQLVTVGIENGAVRERGMLFFQDLSTDLGSQITLSMRVVAFHTESYESRVYQYESDLPGAFSSPALFERGMRCYALIRYRWGQYLTLSAKYAQTSREKSARQHAGADRQIGFQLDVRY